MKTRPAIVQKPCVMCSPEGASLPVEKGQTVDWPAEDFDRACKSGLIAPSEPKAK